jgi:hypothetical protein
MLTHTRVKCKQLRGNSFMVSITRLIPEERQRNDVSSLRLSSLFTVMFAFPRHTLSPKTQTMCSRKCCCDFWRDWWTQVLFAPVYVTPNESQTAGSVCYTLLDNKFQRVKKFACSFFLIFFACKILSWESWTINIFVFFCVHNLTVSVCDK